MALPVPTLDDRRFDDLLAEAMGRIAAHTPEWTNPAPGDPGTAIVEMFAWLAETIIYRQNLIPLRQRRAFLNLLGIPLRAAAPARGMVAVDAPGLPLPPALAAGEARFAAGDVRFMSGTDLQPVPLSLVPMIKAPHAAAVMADQAALLARLAALYGITDPRPFVATRVLSDRTPVRLADTLDGALWLALVAPKTVTATPDALRAALAGVTLSIGLAPPADPTGDGLAEAAADLPPRTLDWSVVLADPVGARLLPLDVVADGSLGGRRRGVVQLRLPSRAALLAPPVADDPMDAGRGGLPPELPVDVPAEKLVAWLRLGAADRSVVLAHCSVNAVEIVAQVVERDQPLGTGDGGADRAFRLRGAPVDPQSLVVEVWQNGTPEVWRVADTLAGAGRDERVLALDAAAGTITFGDGVRGRLPTAGAVIVARRYAWGGGAAGNLAPGSVKTVTPAAGTVRHEWPIAGGRDGETVAQAERRIPAFLAHRDRCVTADDFASLAQETPGVSVARAEVVSGLLPGVTAAATRLDVPGVVSVFIVPDAAERRTGAAPVATLGQLRDVFAFLRPRALIGTQLFVLNPERVPLAVTVAIRLLHGTDVVATGRAVERAVLDWLWPLAPGGPEGGGWPLGRSIAADEILTQIARVPGVLAADGVGLYGQVGIAWAATGVLDLTPWQLPELASVTVSADGVGLPAPPDPTVATPGQAVPFVPDVC